MKYVYKTVGIVTCLLLFVLFDVPARGQQVVPGARSVKPGFRPKELIVKIRDELPTVSRGMLSNSRGTESRNLNLLNEQFGVTNVEQVFRSRTGFSLKAESPLSNVLLMNLGAEVDEKTALRAYSSLEEVEFAELNYLYYIFGVPNDAFVSSQYSLYNGSYQGIDAIAGWDIEEGDQSVIIAIVDTGIDADHEDLAGKVIKGYDFVNEDFDPDDDHGHGTHVAGIAGAIANNGTGIAGVCPGCSLLAVKVITADGAGANSWIANGIANAVSLGARVINLSLGGLDQSQTIKLAIEQAYQQGVVVIAASGNDGTSLPLYPAAFSEVIAVGATDPSGNRADFSSYGNHLELAAPGQSIYSTLPGNSYDAWNGTSMASPHVAGLAGLILSRNPSLSNDQVRQILSSTADDLGEAGHDSSFGYGRIDALDALTETPDNGGNYPMPNPNPTPEPYPSPSPGDSYSCGQNLGTLLGLTLLGLGWVHLGTRKSKQSKKLRS